MDNFFDGFEAKIEPQIETVYPAWVMSSKSIELSKQFYNAVEEQFSSSKELIQNRTFNKISDLRITQSDICKKLGKQRSALKNHRNIIDLINAYNLTIEKMVDSIKNEKSLVRKTKSQLRQDLENHKKSVTAKTKLELERLLSSNLIESHKDILYKFHAAQEELAASLRTNARLKQVNRALQDEVQALQRKIFQMK